MATRAIQRIIQARPTIEGAGVHLRRAFGFGETRDFDPFLLFDDFRNDNPDDYVAGFPWHPHRGIETITYMLAGTVSHGDSLGNSGTLGPGDVQWMTAGSGILHQEMPAGDAEGRMHGFQLWANLPAALKMTEPRYQDVASPDIPEVIDDDGVRVRIVCGEFAGRTGPVAGIAAAPRYLDVGVPPGQGASFAVDPAAHAFAYVFDGAGTFGAASQPGSGAGAGAPGVASRPDAGGTAEAESRSRGTPGETGNRSLVLFAAGDEVAIQAGDTGIRFLLVSGRPLEEPVAWRGPIVMNTDEELRQAYAELRDGTFIKSG